MIIEKMGRLHITADKSEICDFPKLPLPTYFISKTLSAIAGIIKNSNDHDNVNIWACCLRIDGIICRQSYAGLN